MKIKVQQATDYHVSLGENILLTTLQEIIQTNDYFLCIDHNVDKLYGHSLLAELKQQARACIIITATEQHKSQTTVEQIHQTLFAQQATRTTQLIAIGGGIIGDVVGFAAATYLRGIPFIQVPTTLLAQVDSSIGGKVAINAYDTKNIIGTFYSPQHVIIDIHFLQTLTERVFKEGLVELIKHGFIQDTTILSDLENFATISDLRTQPQQVLSLIQKSLLVKKDIVEKDIFDKGERQILNYGHTFAHALEMSNNNDLYHGECVAIGMLISAMLTDEPNVFQQTKAIFERFDCIKPLPVVDLNKIYYDKKRQNQHINEIILTAVGSPRIVAFTVPELMQQFQTAYHTLQQTPLHISKPCFVIYPSNLAGQVTLPASKSMLHRYLLAASLAQKPTTLTSVGKNLADDIHVTINALKQVGTNISYDAIAETLTIVPPHTWLTPTTPFDMQESGTSLRVLLPSLIHNCHNITITGANKLPTRPLTTYFEALNQVKFQQADPHAFLPLTCEGVIEAKDYQIPGNISSQFISGLLFTLPLLEKQSTITISTPLESASYVQLTLATLAQFNIEIQHNEALTYFVIPGKQQYQTQEQYEIEPDYSARCFWDVANTFPNNTIDIVPPYDGTTLQGDAQVTQLIAQQQQQIDLMHIPDAAPILALYLSQRNGQLQNVQRLKFKESNRLEAICAFLSELHVPFTHNDDILEIQKAPVQGGSCNTFLDHRITMTLAIAATISQQPIYLNEITSPEKSYAHFISDYQKLGGKIDEK